MAGIDGLILLSRGDILFRQGSPARAIYTIERGRIRLERHTFDGRRVVLHTARAGQTFAEAALFSDFYHCDAVASEASQVRARDKAGVLKSLREDPRQAEAFLAAMARQLHGLRQRVELQSVRSAADRMLLYFDLVAAPDGAVAIQGELQDIAADLGMSREAFYRTLAALEKAGAITRVTAKNILLNRRPRGTA